MKIVIVLALALVAPLVAVSANVDSDRQFYEKAAQGGMTEVELGNLAQQKSSNPDVKDFGAMMVADHSSANQKLQAVADAKNMTLPTTIGLKNASIKTKLGALSGKAFDKAYIQDMIKDHEEDIALFKKEASMGADADAKAFAQATLPTLEAHLTKIRSLAEEAGVTASR